MKKLFLLLTAITFSVANVPAQKWLNKALDKVDNALDKANKFLDSDTKTDTSTPVQSENKTVETKPAETSSTNAGQVQSLLFSTTLKKGMTHIKPHFTKNTKVIYMEKLQGMEMTLFNEGIAFVKKPKKDYQGKDLWGAIDTLGNQVFDYKFEWFNWSNKGVIPYFYDGVFPCWGSNVGMKGVVLINKKGEVVKNFPDMTDFTNFVEGVACGIVHIVDKQKSTSYKTVTYPRVVYFNTKGEAVYHDISFDCPNANYLEAYRPNYFSDDLAAYYDYNKKRWGFINRKGEIIIPAQYKNVHSFSEGLAAVKNENDYWGFINTKGEVALDFRYSNEPGSFREGISVVRKREGNTVCMIDKTGNIVKDNLHSASNFFDNVSAITYSSDQGFQYALMHRDLKTYEKIKKFPNGWYYNNGIMYINGYGVIARDMDSYLLEAKNFKGPFQEGFATCLLNAKDGNHYDTTIMRPAYINKKGEVIIVFELMEF